MTEINKEIEEMAEIISNGFKAAFEGVIANVAIDHASYIIAQNFIGYRKQSDTAKELAEIKAENDSLKDKLEEIEQMWAYECGCNAELVETQRENERLKARLKELKNEK